MGHAHVSIRLRQLPALVIWAAFRLHLQRLVLVITNPGCGPDCRDDSGVIEAEEEDPRLRWEFKPDDFGQGGSGRLNYHLRWGS